jgi:hypothetical protein
LYVEHGFYKEYLVSITTKGIEGLEINQMMINLRENPLKEINGQVIIVEDYQSSMAKIY